MTPRLEEVWAEYRTSLKAFLLSRVANMADVDDLLQDILLKIHSKLHQLKQSDRIKPWLFQIAQHSIIDYYRSHGRQTKLAIEFSGLEESKPSIQQALAHCIEPFLQGMKNEDAELLRMIDLEGVSQKDYAAAHDMAYSTLKSRVQKARQALRARFESCCHYQIDHQGNLMGFEEKQPPCKKR